MRYNIDGVIGEITSLPGCSQVGVSHSLYVPIEKRNQGLATSAAPNRFKFFVEDLGYDYLLCTIDNNNTTQKKILLANGWYQHVIFKSSKTGHNVALFGKHKE